MDKLVSSRSINQPNADHDLGKLSEFAHRVSQPFCGHRSYGGSQGFKTLNGLPHREITLQLARNPATAITMVFNKLLGLFKSTVQLSKILDRPAVIGVEELSLRKVRRLHILSRIGRRQPQCNHALRTPILLRIGQPV
ncbi:hypothetical protein [Aeoliella sp.]|uniref:hypothetical protein n=1 Tax=Aeoliella sp. TaxID=2795800 RepID=UPI003CCB9D40